MFFEMYFMKLIVLHEEMLHNLRCVVHVFPWFKQENYNELHEIYFLNVHRAANMLYAIYLWNMFHAICFVDARCALHAVKYVYFYTSFHFSRYLMIYTYHYYINTHTG